MSGGRVYIDSRQPFCLMKVIYRDWGDFVALEVEKESPVGGHPFREKVHRRLQPRTASEGLINRLWRNRASRIEQLGPVLFFMVDNVVLNSSVKGGSLPRGWYNLEVGCSMV